jgi:hypothetical protein
LPTTAICCRIFTPALPDYPAASVREFLSGAFMRTYRFYLGRFVAYIKVDRRPFPERFVGAALSGKPPLHIISRDLAASKESRVIERVFDANSRYFSFDGRGERP